MANIAAETGADAKRLFEIVKILRKYKVTQGISPDGLCDMLRELGPTFVKLGQLLSMHPEIIPMEHCKKLEALRTDASRLVTAQICDIITEEYGRPWNKVFKQIMPYPLGAASIAQVHEAVLLDGTHVAVKIQRPEIYSVMERDVRLIKGALNVVKIKKINSVMDIGDTIDEVWAVAQEEMDFIREAENLHRVRENIKVIKYVYCPKVYDELTTKNILVMEYIGGLELTDKAGLIDLGYDLQEVCTKFINNYIKQFAEDRFFHADPHPGNVRVWDGRIVWLDLGMMGVLTETDAELIKICMKSIVTNDYIAFADTILDICEHDPAIDMGAYHERMRVYLDKYRVVSMAQMSSTVDIFADLYRIARDFGIKVPKTLTMFWRSLSIMEGTVSDLSPDTDLAAIIGKHMAAQALVTGVAGSISKKVSHRKLISGGPLSYMGHVHEPEEEIPDTEDVAEIEITLGYGHKDEVVRLFNEYTNMLVESDETVRKYLVLQSYDDEIENPEIKYGMPDGRLYIAMCGDKPAGCVAMHKLDDTTCELKRLYVRPQYRGAKLGQKLVSRVIDDARKIGYSAMLLDTLPFLTPAICLYENLGFYYTDCYNNSPVDTTIFMKYDL